MVSYQNTGYYEAINVEAIISSTTTIEESTDSNNDLTQKGVITTGDNSNVNEGMGGINEVTMKTDEAYGTTKQLQMAQLTCDNISNPSPVSHDPLATIEESTDSNSNHKAYGEIFTTGHDYNVNKRINDITMKTNKLYGTTKQLQMAPLTYDNLANPSPVSHDPSEQGIR